MVFSVLAASGDVNVTAASLSSAVKSISSKFTGIKKIGGYKYYFVKGKMQTGFKTVKKKKYYFTSSGKALKKQFKTIKGKKYYFTAASYAKVGILNKSGKRYYFNKNGVRKTGIRTYNGKKYYFAPSGKKVTGFKTINGKRYYIRKTGVLQTGFRTINGKRYYFGTNGVMKKGFQVISGKTYYFGTNGVMKTGFQTIGGVQYYFNSKGVMQTGYTWVGDKLYYIESGGMIYYPTSNKGWVTVGGTKTYYTENGVQLKNIVMLISGKYYGFDANGTIYAGFTKIGANTYYFDPSTGAAATGWTTIDGEKYYFSSLGYMAYGMSIINDHLYSFTGLGVLNNNGTIEYDGETYTQLSDGSITKIWFTQGSNTYYFDANGAMVKKTTTIDGIKYFFNSDGTLLVKSVTRKGIDVSKWNGNINWSKVKAAGVEFAMIRIGYEYTLDPYFKTNIEGAKAAGISVGVYIYSYAETVAEAKKEANFVIENLKGYKLEYPVAFDIEDDVQKCLTDTRRSNIVTTFCDALQDAGYYTTVYSSKSWLENNFTQSKISGYDKWVAQWPYTKSLAFGTNVDKSNCTYKYDYGMWQYSSKGSVSGISGNVDLDYSFIDYPSLMRKMGYNNY